MARNSASQAMEALERRAMFAAGQLDATFGAGGLVATPATWLGRFDDLQVQRDGKILALLAGGDAAGKLTVERYTRDGSLDTSYGVNGRATLGPDYGGYTGQSLLLQPDGKVVVVGQQQLNGVTEAALARFNTDGSGDATFGDGGLAYSNFGSGMFGQAATMQPDGKFVVTGFSWLSRAAVGDQDWDWFVTRFNADGSIDSSFANGGRIDYDVYNDCDYPVSVFVGDDGKITTVGAAWVPGKRNYDLGVLRLNADGTPDKALDGDGYIAFPDFQPDLAARMPDGKFLVSDIGSTLVRYNADWTLDHTFGEDGFSHHGVGGQVWDLWVQPDGRILRAGDGGSGLSVARLNYDGSPDLSFGVNGSITVAQNGDPHDEENYGRAMAVAADADGRILLGGFLDGEKMKVIACIDPGPFAVDAFGVLRLNGGETNDTITLKRDGDYLLASVNNLTARVRPGGLRGITIQARGGDDVVVVYSGVMGCYISGGEGNDRLVGGDGYDNIVGNAGKDRIDGGLGDDRLAGSGGNDAIVGSPGNDRIYGDAGNDRVEAGQGADRIWGGIGDDLLAGGSGNDMLDGQGGVNTLAGGLGADRLYNVSGFDMLYLNLPTTTTWDEQTALMTIIEVVEMV